MSHRTDSEDRALQALLEGGPAPDPARHDLAEVAAFLTQLQHAYRDGPAPRAGAALATVFSDGLAPSASAGIPATERVSAPGRAAAVALAFKTRRTRMLSTLSTLLSTLTGKLLLGTAVAAASVGGAHAGGVIDFPGLPDRSPPAVEGVEDGAEPLLLEEEAGAAQAPDSLTDPGVDGDGVSERAQELGEGEPGDGREFGQQTRDEAISGTPAEDTPAADAGPATGEQHRQEAVEGTPAEDTPAADAGPATGQQASEAGAGNADTAPSGSQAPEETPSGTGAETGANAAEDGQSRRP